MATLGSDYGPTHDASAAVDQVVVEHGTLPVDELYHALRPHSVNLGEVDYAALLAGRPQDGDPQPGRHVPAVPHRRCGRQPQHPCRGLRCAAPGKGPVARRICAIRLCLVVIASEAKQSSSLAHGTALDCFVASLLAMTRICWGARIITLSRPAAPRHSACYAPSAAVAPEKVVFRHVGRVAARRRIAAESLRQRADVMGSRAAANAEIAHAERIGFRGELRDLVAVADEGIERGRERPRLRGSRASAGRSGIGRSARRRRAVGHGKRRHMASDRGAHFLEQRQHGPRAADAVEADHVGARRPRGACRLRRGRGPRASCRVLVHRQGDDRGQSGFLDRLAAPITPRRVAERSRR